LSLNRRKKFAAAEADIRPPPREFSSASCFEDTAPKTIFL
jgi:hypothetical protein